jgi:hypothetical protein
VDFGYKAGMISCFLLSPTPKAGKSKIAAKIAQKIAQTIAFFCRFYYTM